MKARLVWDVLTSPWTTVPKPKADALLSGKSVIFDLKPPVDWHFDKDMIYALEGQIALEQTRVQVEVRL